MRPIASTTLLTLALAGTALAGPASADPDTVSRQVTGLLAGGQLVTFDSGDVGAVSAPVTVVGLGVGETLVAIDYRPNGGALYGVTDAADGQRLYTISPSGVAAVVGTTPFANVPGDISIDFNPTVDRLRVVSSEGANLRVNPVGAPPATVDGALRYGTAASGAPVAQGIAGAAYTNNDNDCVNSPVTVPCTVASTGQPGTGTQLLDLDAALDQLALQAPPNDGVLTARGPVEQDLSAAGTGFDIHTPAAGGNEAFVSLSKNGKSRLLVIDLATGLAQPAGKIGADVVDIALPIGQ